MQRVAYPYTMLMIMKVSFHYFLLSFILFLFYIYLDSSLSEAVEYGVPCSCGEGTRVNNVSDKKKVFACTHGCVIVYSLRIELSASSIGTELTALHSM